MERLEHLWAAINERWPPYLRDNLTLLLVGGGLVLNLGLWLWLAIAHRSMPPFVPLHFDAFGNPDRIAPRSDIFSIPTIGLIVYVINGLAGVFLRRRIPFAGYLLWGGAALVQILLIGAAIQIVS